MIQNLSLCFFKDILYFYSNYKKNCSIKNILGSSKYSLMHTGGGGKGGRGVRNNTPPGKFSKNLLIKMQ